MAVFTIYYDDVVPYDIGALGAHPHGVSVRDYRWMRFDDLIRD